MEEFGLMMWYALNTDDSPPNPELMSNVEKGCVISPILTKIYKKKTQKIDVNWKFM